MPLLKAVIVKADTALVAAFTGILVAHATTLLCRIWLLIVVSVVIAHIPFHATIGWEDDTLDTAGSWSAWSVAFQIRLNNFASVPQQIQNSIVGCFGFPAAVSKPSCYYILNNNNYPDRMCLVK